MDDTANYELLERAEEELSKGKDWALNGQYDVADGFYHVAQSLLKILQMRSPNYDPQQRVSELIKDISFERDEAKQVLLGSLEGLATSAED